MDPSGIYMLKSIQEIFQTMKLDIENIKLNLNIFSVNEIKSAIDRQKCPVIIVSRVSPFCHFRIRD